MSTTLSAPWLNLLVLTPLLAAAWVRWSRARPYARRIGVIASSATLGIALGFYLESLGWGSGPTLVDPLDPLRALGGTALWHIDALNAPLLPFAALICWAIILLTPRTERRNDSLSNALLSEAFLLGLLASREAWAIGVFYFLGLVPVALECRARRTEPFPSHRPFLRHAWGGGILLGAAVLVQALSHRTGVGTDASAFFTIPVLLVVLSRKGIAPLHSWLPSFFERGPFRLALLWSMPQAGVYLAARLLVPHAAPELLAVLALLSLATAVYAAGLALVQTDARRLFGYFFMSQSALVLVGFGGATRLGLTAALTLWLASSLSLTGLGLTLWALEARRGRLSLLRHHGGYELTPTLAVCFLIMGLTSVGFPGTLGFIGQELLVDAALQQRSFGSIAIMTAIVINGITVLRTYLILFCGARSSGYATQRMRPREKVGVLTLATLVLLGGVFPQPLVRTRDWPRSNFLHCGL